MYIVYFRQTIISSKLVLCSLMSRRNLWISPKKNLNIIIKKTFYIPSFLFQTVADIIRTCLGPRSMPKVNNLNVLYILYNNIVDCVVIPERNLYLYTYLAISLFNIHVVAFKY